MTEHDEQEDEQETGLRDYLEELGLRQAELIQREIRSIVGDAIVKLRAELAAEKAAEAERFVAAFRREMREMDGPVGAPAHGD